MSDINTGALSGTSGTTGGTRRTDQAKQLIGQAGETLKAEAQSFAAVAQDRVRAEAQRGTDAATKTLGDFANAIRKAGDELAGADQSPASRLVRQAADGFESLSRNLAGKDPGELLNAVRDFGRRNPAAFIGGAVLVGVALGRFARATEPDGALRRIGEEDMAFVEERTFEASDDLGATGGLAAPLTDDGSTGVLDDETPAGSLASSTSPHTGGR